MNYIVGLCGTHGTGKSTILQGVKEAGITTNQSQLSRIAQKELGWDSLSKAQDSVDNMWALQDAILNAMHERDTLIHTSQVMTVVERTPADMWAYTKMWCNRLSIDIHDNRVVSYCKACHNLADRYLQFVYVPPIDAIPFKVDPHRADKESRQSVANYVSSFLSLSNHPTYKIATVSQQDRVKEMLVLLED